MGLAHDFFIRAKFIASDAIHTRIISRVVKMACMAHTTRNMTVPALNRDKYTQALLYFITECGNEHLGITKLNKLFYYLDFISYRDRRTTVTGETYVHLSKGPLATSLETDIIVAA